MSKGKANSSLKSWVAFVKKVQKEENISYPEAMKRASARKSEWKRGGGDSSASSTLSPSPYPSESTLESGSIPTTSTMSGGKRKTKKNRKTRKTRKTRKSRKSRTSRN